MASSVDLEQYLKVSISEDKMQAFVHFIKYDDLFFCSSEELEAFLAKHDVRYGIRTKLLSDIAAYPQTYRSGMSLIAEGKPPVHGEDGVIRVLTGVTSQPSRPLEQEDGSVDLKEIGVLNNVIKGQRIAERIAAIPAIPGMNISGEVTVGKDGKEARFMIGKNVVTDAEQSSLYAAIDGLIVKTDKERINVFPVYEVNGDVDYRTGNIDFVGTVIVRGNVLTGFKIKAVGDIRVYGGVEGAQLEANGSVEVIGGIIAGNKGHVHANVDVKCVFMQEAKVSAGGNVIVSQSIMHSQVRAGKQVICNGTKGLIVGGMIQAGECVQARTIGNTMSTVTILEVGVQPEYRNELSELRSKMRDSMSNLEKTEKALRILDPLALNGQLSNDRMAMRMKLYITKKSIMNDQTDMRERIFEIEKMLEESGASRIDVFQHIYGGSKIVIGRSVRFVKDVCKRVSFRMIDGEVGMVSL